MSDNWMAVVLDDMNPNYIECLNEMETAVAARF
jgi:hypothetical protein